VTEPTTKQIGDSIQDPERKRRQRVGVGPHADQTMNAIELTNVTKVYRKYARRKQFATLKSALLKGSLIQDLQPEETFHLGQ